MFISGRKVRVSNGDRFSVPRGSPCLSEKHELGIVGGFNPRNLLRQCRVGYGHTEEALTWF
jgi:hypothetical protein